MQARRRQEQRETVRLALDAARWGFARNIEPSEVADAITRVSHDDVVGLSRELFSGRMSVALLGDVGQVAIDDTLLSPA